MNQLPTTLPRRAGTISRAVAAMAHKKMTETGQRQAASDRIGYAIAVGLGAVAFKYGGPGWVAFLAAGYLFNAWMAFRRWKALTA